MQADWTFGDPVSSLFLLSRELSQPLFEYRPRRKSHRTGVGVEVDKVLPVPLSPVLNLPNALANDRVG